ncbi:MAG: hypothetical protein ACE5EI_09825 [Thermodesulfobacteriota bacterium]
MGWVWGEILDEISSAVEAGLVKGKKDAIEHIRGWLSGGRPAGHGKVLD